MQPLYTALREGARLALESLAPRRDLATTRRIAGLAAGGVLAVLGVVLIVLIVLEVTGAIDIFKRA